MDDLFFITEEDEFQSKDALSFMKQYASFSKTLAGDSSTPMEMEEIDLWNYFLTGRERK